MQISGSPKSTQPPRQKKPLPPVPTKDFLGAPVPPIVQLDAAAETFAGTSDTPKNSFVDTGETFSGKKGKRLRGIESPDGVASKKKRVTSPAKDIPVSLVGPNKKVQYML